MELVEQLGVRSFTVNDRGTGDAQYHPSMLCALLVYCYATGRFASRRIEEATYSDVAVRHIAGDTHPDHRQHNFTDPDSHIMKAGSGRHFEQCYNAQAAVDTEGSMMVQGP